MTDRTGAADVKDFSTTGRAPGAPGAPCWVSLTTRDPGAARGFYGPLLDWEFTPGAGRRGNELVATAQGRPVAGIGPLPPEVYLPTVWTPFLSAADVDGAAVAVRQCGGTVGVGPLDDAQGGRFAFCSDPAGALFGIRRLPSGWPPPAPELPGSLAWLELVVAEERFAATFYETVFGHRRQTPVSPDGPLVLRQGDRPLLAVHGAGPSVHRAGGPHWLTYFTTEDVDHAVALAARLGGRITRPPTDGAHGRTAQLVDPEGTPFGLLTPATARVPLPAGAVPDSGVGSG